MQSKRSRNIALTITALLLALVLVFGQTGSAPRAALTESDTALTRADAFDIIFSSAVNYNTDLKKEDVETGYVRGATEDAKPVSRVEALAMISSAFGEMPVPVGDNLRRAPAEEAIYTDAPGWASSAIANLNQGKLLIPAEDNLLKPDETITRAELDTYLRRVWSLFGTRLEDDFYAAVNKEWLETKEILESESSVLAKGEANAGLLLQRKAEDAIDAILDEIMAGDWDKDSTEQKVKDYYASLLNMNILEAAAPLKPYLDKLAAVNNVGELNAALAALTEATTYQPFILFNLLRDYEDGAKYAITVSDTFSSIVTSSDSDEEFLASVTDMLTHGNVSDPSGTAKSVARIRSLLAAQLVGMIDIWDIPEEDWTKENHRFTMAQLQAMIPNADLGALLAANVLAPEDSYIVRSDSEFALNALGKLYTDENAADLAALAEYITLYEYKRMMGDNFAPDDGATAKTAEELDSAARKTVKEDFQDFLSVMYGKRNTSDETKADITMICEELIAQYKLRVQSLDWMKDSTKAEAIKKLDNMSLLVAYPDHLPDYSKLNIGGGTFFDNAMALRKFKSDARNALQGSPAVRDNFIFPSFMANGVADPDNNTIAVMSGILFYPFYDVNMTLEEKIAGIGTVIAHEITHNFDPGGSRFDEFGVVRNWWTAEDKAKFTELCGEVTQLYGTMEYAPGLVRMQGVTTDEDVADLGGMFCALATLKRLKPDADLALYFRHAALIWRDACTHEAYLAETTNFHNHSNLRINMPLMMIPEFYETFGIKEGDGMYLPPEQRIEIW